MANYGRRRYSASLLLVFALIVPVAPPVAVGSGGWPTSTASGSWALGVVVPQGSAIYGRAKLDWGASSNLTVDLRLPLIGQVDNTVYAIVSVMATSGTIMQVAAGIYPGMSTWRTYVLLVKDSASPSQSYVWIANASEPSMPPGGNVSLSIYAADGGWRYKVTDLDSSGSSEGIIVSDTAATFTRGDQEVIALESYTATNGVFASMGAMEVEGIFVDGGMVTGGWYGLGGWDPQHDPLFLVGGHEPPSFASISFANSTVDWLYSAEGHVEYVPASGYGLAAFVGATVIITASVLALAFLQRKKRKD